MLRINDNITELADVYFRLLNIPEKSKIDAFHLAFAVWYNIDFLVTWNCKHIANAKNIQKVNNYNNVNNLDTCFLYTSRTNGGLVCGMIILLKK